MAFRDLVKRATDAVVQAALVTYYFMYYLVKGKDENEGAANQLCIDNKPNQVMLHTAVLPPVAPVTPITNVCCLHGVQTKTAPLYHPPPPPLPATKKPKVESGKTENASFSWLNPKTWVSSKQEDRHQPAPIAPPRHLKPHENVANGSSSQQCHGQSEKNETWLEKAWSYLPSIGHKTDTSGQRPPSPTSTITQRIVRVVAIPSPGTPGGHEQPTDIYVAKSSQQSYQQSFKQGPQEQTRNDLARQLKHAVEPHYPVTLSHDDSSYRPSLPFQPVKPEYVPPAPPPPQVKAGQANVQIHVKPKQIPSNVKPDDAWVTATTGFSEVQRQVPAVWSPGQQAQPHAASTIQVQTQRQQLRKSTETRPVVSPTPYEPEDGQKSVRDLKRQWPPPSNATGVEIVKELVFPSGAPGDLSNAVSVDGDTTFNYDVYRPSATDQTAIRTKEEERRIRDYSGGRNDYSEVKRDTERSAVSPERFRQLSQELTSKSSAGKGVEMFVRRRQKVESWMNEEQPHERAPPAPIISPVQRMLPVAAPRKRVSANEVVDSVVEAASRKEHHWQPTEPTPVPIPPSSRPEVSSPIHREVERVASPAPATSWRQYERHERFFSPQPFQSGGSHPARDRLFTPPPLTHEPKMQQQAYRSMSVLGDKMEQKEFIDWKSGPDMTTTVVSANTPSMSRTMKTSTYAASRGSQYTKTSTINTLPRTWKSYSEAYNQAYN